MSPKYSIHSCFQTYDIDGSGTLDLTEIKMLLRTISQANNEFNESAVEKQIHDIFARTDRRTVARFVESGKNKEAQELDFGSFLRAVHKSRQNHTQGYGLSLLSEKLKLSGSRKTRQQIFYVISGR